LKQKILKEKARGKSTIISSHVLSELDEMITEVIYMQDGQVLFQKTLKALQQETQEVKLSKMIAKIIA
jgi:Cu-processing system ATP-binding protein